MLKKTLNLCLLALAMFFMVHNICMADAVIDDAATTTEPKEIKNSATADAQKQTGTKTTKTSKKKKKGKKHPKKAKDAGVTADTITDSPSDSDNSPKKAQGPAYPFVNETRGAEHLACNATPFIQPAFANKKPMSKGNNLMRKPGSPSRASGDYIQISGMVVDENCLPIQGVVLEIWQTDSHGHYEWEYDRESYWALPPAGKDNNFLYSGSAHTDNLGAFDFMTMMPASHDGDTPYINVIVKRAGYEELHTRIYFSGQALNDGDKSLAGLSDEGRAALVVKGKPLNMAGAYEGTAYYFPITLRGISPYKRF